MTARHSMWSQELEAALAQPFPPALVGWKPQWVNEGKDGGIAVPYVDPRYYYARLDELVGPEGWDAEPEIVTPTTIKIRVTILGVTRYGIGEKAANDQNTLAGAEAQAFKRACAHGFDLGRYLYTHMSQVFAKMAPQGKSAMFSAEGKAQLRQAAVEQTGVYQEYLDGKIQPQYRDAMGPELADAPPTATPARTATPPSADAVPFVYPDEGDEKPVATAGPPPPEGEIPQLNYAVPSTTKSGAKSAPSKHTGITGRDIQLRELIQAGEKGVKYIEWMAENFYREDGKAAATAVLEWLSAGNTLAITPHPTANPVAAPQQASPQHPPAPDTSDYPGGINNMQILAEAFGTHPGDAWSIISKAGIKAVPKPDEQDVWAVAWGAMVAAKGKPGGGGTEQQPPFGQ